MLSSQQGQVVDSSVSDVRLPARPATSTVQPMTPSDHGGREGSVLDAFVDLADSLVDDYDPLDFLYRLLDHSLPLTGAAAGGVLLHYEGRLHLVASSSEQAEAAALLELRTRQGPAREAFRTGDVVRVDQIAASLDRWPEFAEAATSDGWTSALAVPLRLRDYIAGSLVVYWSDDTHDHPNDVDAKLVRGFADVATIAVLQRRTHSDVEKLNDQLHTALEGRIKVEQAKGMIANATGLPVGTAFEHLRRHARSTRQPLSSVVAAVVAGHLDIAVIANG